MDGSNWNNKQDSLFCVFHRIHPVVEATKLIEYVIQYFASDICFPGDGQQATAVVAIYREHICRTHSQLRSSLGWCWGLGGDLHKLPCFTYLLTPPPILDLLHHQAPKFERCSASYTTSQCIRSRVGGKAKMPPLLPLLQYPNRNS